MSESRVDPLVCPRGHHSVQIGANRFRCVTCYNQDRDDYWFDKSELVDLRYDDPPLAGKGESP